MLKPAFGEEYILKNFHISRSIALYPFQKHPRNAPKIGEFRASTGETDDFDDYRIELQFCLPKEDNNGKNG